MQRGLKPRLTQLAILLALGLAVILAVWVWRMSSVEVPTNAPELAGEMRSVMRDRLLAATVIGMALGAAGVLLRTATGNPLADPEITGVNSGAAFGAVLCTTITGSVSGAAVLPGALCGAALGAAITVGIGMRVTVGDPTGAQSVQRMILLGIAVSALFSACTAIILVIDEAQLSTVLSWLSGRLGGVRFPDVVPCIIAVAVVLPFTIAAGRGLDTLFAGDALSSSVGANPHRLRILAVVGAVLLIAPAVAAAGPIGFLGLMAAVVSYRVAGPRHRLSLVIAPVVGAVVLLVADSVAQALWAPAETPVGVVTAIAGVPLLLWGINRLRPGGGR
ncbi:iron ABC transporter permease [Corynebacterium jeikeium]|nr:iron ABC transporter permease [Corynebacterium jeikeium]WCZ53908.1 Fe(3+) dicitrate transport system permease protein FecC [Corynebacterium jeikeium]SUY80788.1 iron ABC transport system, permease [Corynebacterium jeikeium]